MTLAQACELGSIICPNRDRLEHRCPNWLVSSSYDAPFWPCGCAINSLLNHTKWAIALSVLNYQQHIPILAGGSMNTEFTQVFELTLAEKLQLLEDLWDSIAEVPEQIPMLDWQKVELAKRKRAYLQNPDAGSSWEAVKDRIRNRQQGA